jgi:transcriptional regulator with XRE-family HTH domain
MSRAQPREPAKWQSAFGRQLRAARVAAGLTQVDLAQRTDISSAYISQVELGQRNVSLVNICVLALGVDSTPSELLTAVTSRRARR